MMTKPTRIMVLAGFTFVAAFGVALPLTTAPAAHAATNCSQPQTPYLQSNLHVQGWTYVGYGCPGQVTVCLQATSNGGISNRYDCVGPTATLDNSYYLSQSNNKRLCGQAYRSASKYNTEAWQVSGWIQFC